MTIDLSLDDLVPLGEGPVATVFAGVAEDGRSAFALKVFPGPLPRRERGEVERELARQRPLAERAPLLVPDAVDALPDGRAVVRMALCTQSLTELVGSAGPLDGGDVLALGEAIAVALAALHGAGVVHGGVSPDNVLFGPEGEPLLADAGTALREAFGGDGGPPGYRAPETLREAVVDERTDLYGLGALLYFALTGGPPHGEQPPGDPAAYVLRILNEPVSPPARPDVPAELLGLVGALLSADPADRPIDAHYVAGRLAAAAAAPAPEPGPPSAERELVAVAGPAARRKSSGRLGLVIAVPVMIAVVVAVAVLLLRDEPAPLSPPAEPPAPVSPSAPSVTLALDPPVDQGSVVELTWHAEGAQLRFAVVVAAEGAQATTRFTGQERTLREPVTPGVKYCFLVQATDGVHTFQSASRAIRGATCNR